MITDNLYFAVNSYEILRSQRVPSVHKLIVDQLKNGTAFSDNIMDKLKEKYPGANVSAIFGKAVYDGDLNYMTFDEKSFEVDDYETWESHKSGIVDETVFVLPVTFDDEKFLYDKGYRKIG